MPDIPHAIEPVGDTVYSMISVCVPADRMPGKSENEISYLENLKRTILNAPEDVFLIEDMAESIGVSPYHMIRRFKDTCGLTPPQSMLSENCRTYTR